LFDSVVVTTFYVVLRYVVSFAWRPVVLPDSTITFRLPGYVPIAPVAVTVSLRAPRFLRFIYLRTVHVLRSTFVDHTFVVRSVCSIGVLPAIAFTFVRFCSAMVITVVTFVYDGGSLVRCAFTLRSLCSFTVTMPLRYVPFYLLVRSVVCSFVVVVVVVVCSTIWLPP